MLLLSQFLSLSKLWDQLFAQGRSRLNPKRRLPPLVLLVLVLGLVLYAPDVLHVLTALNALSVLVLQCLSFASY